MQRLRRILRNDIKGFVYDFRYHFLYTFFIIILTSFTTSYVLSSKIQKDINKIAPMGQTQTALSGDEELYTERGSPYDNRSLSASESANVVFHGPRDKKKIALTFDAEMTDGMRAAVVSGRVKSSYDKRIIDTLNNTNTKATLFLTGMWIELYPKETEELSKNPLLEFGSHSYTDSAYHGFCYGLKQLPKTVKVEDVGATEKLLRQHAGIDNRFFRFPGGCYGPDDVKLVNEANDTVIHWDVSGADGFNKSVKQIEKNVIDNTQNGSIIILHMNGVPTAPKTAEALPEIISSLKAKGFEFVKISELLNLPPPPSASF